MRESTVLLRGCGGDLRQVTLRSDSLRRPSFPTTNDIEASLSALLGKQARRWLIGKSISDRCPFFHLNQLPSPMVIKVDSDLAMIVFAYNLLSLLALFLPVGLRRLSARSTTGSGAMPPRLLSLAGTCGVSPKKESRPARSARSARPDGSSLHPLDR